MTLPELERQMGRLWAAIQKVSRLLALEEVFDSPLRAAVCAQAPRLRRRLRGLHTQYYALEARIPTPEVLGQQAYDRCRALGGTTADAEQERGKAIYQARQRD